MMDWNKITLEMVDWARVAQAEYNEAAKAYAMTLSNSVNEEGGFSWLDPTSWTEDYAQSPRSRALNSIDTAWIQVKVDALVAVILANFDNPKKQEQTLYNFYDFVESQKNKLPRAYAAWKNIEQTKLPNEVALVGTSEKRPLMLSDFYPLGVGILTAGTTLFVLSKMDSPQPRQNPLPIVGAIAALGWLKGTAAVVGIGTLLGAGATFAIRQTYTPQMKAVFGDLDEKVKHVKSYADKGSVFNGSDKTRFYTDIKFGNTMRICAPSPQLARKQAQFALYAATYATGDKTYADMAEGLNKGWFEDDKFESFTSAEPEMRSVMNVLVSSSNQLVRALGQDFGLLVSASCMQQTQKETEPNEQQKACGGMGAWETFMATMEGLFFFQGKPCNYTEQQWRRTKILVYTPTILVGGYYLMPIIKPLFQLTGSGLQALADKTKKNPRSRSRRRR